MTFKNNYTEMPERLYVPNVIDIEVTGRCEFNCPGCWGSKPSDYKKELTTKKWLDIFKKIDDYTCFDINERIVITGGEPLLRKDLIELIDGLSDEGHRQISMSTTGVDRYDLLVQSLGKLSSIGIPIDGPSPEINSIWRRHNTLTDGGLDIAVNALKMVQKTTPDLYTTVRTLIHSDNVNEVAEIPDFLKESGVDIARIRWILYELNNRKTSPDRYSRLISTNAIKSFDDGPDNFRASVEYAGREFNEVLIRTIGMMAYRNFIINPGGETRAIIPSGYENEATEIEFGNLHKDFKATMELFNDSKEKYFFSRDAADSPEGFYIRQDAGL